MLSIRLDKNLEQSLAEIADATNTTKTALMKEAITRYIDDKTDYILAARALKDVQTTFPLETVLQEFKDELQN
ncbi:MAG: ribbon-helix-helix domain-containing protein [Holosporaceae bacterium]|jgi:predicted DNA-binding protein|nr:ribbon-helix-helix domain-containing protein [Holosporaceae bacterium]